MPLDFPTQEEYFYQKPWNKKRDAIFLNYIMNHFGSTSSRERYEVDECLALAMLHLKKRENIPLNFDDIVCRLHCLKDRYHAFTLVVRDSETFWDNETRLLHAPDSAWQRLVQQNGICGAYYRASEPHYALLLAVFGDKSDYAGSGDSDEATSPVQSTKRKLFADDENLPKDVMQRPTLPRPVFPKKADYSHGASSCASSSPSQWKKGL